MVAAQNAGGDSYQMATNNSFVLDALGKVHMVYGDGTTVEYATNASGSWVTTVLNAPNVISNTHPSLTLDAYGVAQVTYNPQGYVWYTSFGGTAVGTGGGNQPAEYSIGDITMSAAGKPMIVYLQSGTGTTGQVKVAMYNGSTWDISAVTGDVDVRDIGWYNSNGAVQIKVDGSGRPVVLVGSSNVSSGTLTTVNLDYYVLSGGVWTKTNLATLPAVANIFGIDFTFDEAGRPFVAFVYQPTAAGDVQAMYTTTAGVRTCGDGLTQYLPEDLNKDCYVNMLDMKEFAQQWLSCSTPGAAGCVAASTPHIIYQGSPVTVNGDLSDWTDVAWIAMDKTLYGTPSDLTNAKWAAKWSSVTNRIYMAVTGTDAYHYFNTTDLGWNQQDMLEVFVDAGNFDVSDYPAYSYADAQQWTFGPTRGASAGVWGGSYWGYLAGDVSKPVGALVPAAVNVTGTTITYEFELPPYSYFDYSTPANSTYVTLASDMVIGLDVVMSTITNGSLGFGMRCENTLGGKAAYAENFQNYTLKGTGTCGEWGYASGDLVQDCRVNFADFAQFAKKWMQCTDPAHPENCTLNP